MSHYKPYPAYRDSGVEWIGPVPGHWSLGRLRDFVQTISTGPFGTALGSDDYVSDGVPVINPSHIAERGCVPDPAVTVDHAKASQLAFWAMKPGDVVTARRGELGRAAIIGDQEAGWICGTGSIRIAPDVSKIASEYVHTTLQADYARRWLELQSVGSTMPNLSEKLIGDLPVAVPPSVHEQQSLLQHSSEETTRIDALITKKTRFIELLKEKRHALIDHAVTKGLNPDAPMRDSDVEWLGEIPAHWEVRRMASIFREAIRPGDQSLPILSISIHDGITDEEVATEDRDRRVSQIEDRTKYKRVAPNDLAYNMMRAWQGAFGAVTVDGLVSPAYVVAEPMFEFRTAYIENLLRTPMAIEEMRRYSRGIADFRMRLYWDYFRDLKVCLPPLEEQDKILDMIARETSRIDLLAEKTQISIDLLKIRRSAFITAAVTGQIDLRESA